MDEFVEKRVRARGAHWLARVGVVVGCVVALGAGYAAAAGGLGPISVFSSGLTAGGVYGYRPYNMAAGSDGALWFSAISTNAYSAIGRVSTDGTIRTFTTGLPANSDPDAMTLRSDGNVWFKDGGSIGRITPDGTISEFPVPGGLSVYKIAGDAEGNVWLTGRGEISKVTPDGQPTVYNVGPPPPNASDLDGVAAGADAAMWFTVRSPAAIGRITQDGTTTLYSAGLGAKSAPTEIAEGPDGNMWFLDAGAIGRITPAGVITEFSLGQSGNPYGLAAGSDGNIWFTETVGNVLGRITPDGSITEFDMSSHGLEYLLAIKTGSDGGIWLTGIPSDGVPAIVRVDIGSPAASVAPPHVAGSARQGDQQSCDGALWSDWAGQQPSTTGFPFDGYQWLLDGKPVAGQTAQSYTPTDGDVGHQLSCKVTATYTLFPATVSAASAAVTVTAAPGATGGGTGGGSPVAVVTTSTTSSPPAPPPARAPAGGTTAHATTATLSVLRVETVVLHAKPPKLHVTLRASQACTAVVVLRDAKGKNVAAWKLHLARGMDKLALVLPQTARHKGRDTLRLQVRGGKAKVVPVTLRA